MTVGGIGVFNGFNVFQIRGFSCPILQKDAISVLLIMAQPPLYANNLLAARTFDSLFMLRFHNILVSSQLSFTPGKVGKRLGKPWDLGSWLSGEEGIHLICRALTQLLSTLRTSPVADACF